MDVGEPSCTRRDLALEGHAILTDVVCNAKWLMDAVCESKGASGEQLKEKLERHKALTLQLSHIMTALKQKTYEEPTNSAYCKRAASLQLSLASLQEESARMDVAIEDLLTKLRVAHMSAQVA